MTLPKDIILPLPEDNRSSQDPSEYQKELVTELQDMYQDISDNVNGLVRNSVDVDGTEWIPVLKGVTTEGTFTYSFRTGWCLRRGIITDVWGDVLWTATTATGHLYVELPYLVSKSNQLPFVGTCQTSGFVYTGGTYSVMNAIPSTFEGQVWNCGSGINMSQQQVPSSGRIIFHMRYIGQSDD